MKLNPQIVQSYQKKKRTLGKLQDDMLLSSDILTGKKIKMSVSPAPVQPIRILTKYHKIPSIAGVSS